MEKLNAIESIGAAVLRGTQGNDFIRAQGKYTVTCLDSKGCLKWEEAIDNVVTDVGANLMLDTFFGGSQNTTYFLGLISSVGWSAVAAGNTMASHAGWLEAGDSTNLPTWSTPASNARATITWSSASARAKAISSTANFTISAAGTVQGCFIVTGSGAVSTHDSTAGTLYSAGAFSGGAKAVGVGDTLQVSYSTSV